MLMGQSGPRRADGPLRIGEVVEIRSREEILATLDERGELDALPFMPEMLKYAGQRVAVSRLATKACDTITWTGLHRMQDAVHLDALRCDGSAHGGCQAGCLLYWKTAWIKRVDVEDAPSVTGPGCTQEQLLAATRRVGDDDAEAPAYACQTTELMRAAPEVIPFWDPRQYVEDVRSGNSRLREVVRAVLVGLFNKYQEVSRRLLPPRLRIHGGGRYPFIDGTAPKTPTGTLDLEPGERVRVRSREEIFATLDANNRNRGLSFDVEMLKYCGREASVLRRVDQILDEKTGRMLRMKNPCIILEDVTCAGDFHRRCPRGIYSYWREIWLERV